MAPVAAGRRRRRCRCSPWRRATCAVIYEYVGQTAGSREVEVRARVPGILLEAQLQEGATVRRGQSLYSLDPAPFRAALDRADADVASAEARLAMAHAHAGAAEAAVRGASAVSQREYDDAASAEQIARADLKGAQARRAEAALNLAYTRVEAPISGVASAARMVVRRHAGVRPAAAADHHRRRPTRSSCASASPTPTRCAGAARRQAGRLQLPTNGAFDVEVTLADGSMLPAQAASCCSPTRACPATPARIEARGRDRQPRRRAQARPVRARAPARRDAARTRCRCPRARCSKARRASSSTWRPTARRSRRPVKVGDQLGDRWLVTRRA